jgi:hypothetical protein
MAFPSLCRSYDIMLAIGAGATGVLGGGPRWGWGQPWAGTGFNTLSPRAGVSSSQTVFHRGWTSLQKTQVVLSLLERSPSGVGMSASGYWQVPPCESVRKALLALLTS